MSFDFVLDPDKEDEKEKNEKAKQPYLNDLQ